MTRTAIIGAGRISRQHLNCLTALPGVQVAAVCDLSPATAQCMAERYGVKAWFTDHRKMLSELRPDIVHITTPPTSHFRIAMDAADAGAHLFVEKPITATWGEFEELRQHCQRRGVWLLEDHNLRYNAPVATILRKIATGEFGQVVHAEILYCLNILGSASPFTDPNAPHACLRMAGGAIADFLSHLAYLCHAFIGPHRAVRAIWQKLSPDSALPHDELRALVQGEKATALIGFSSHAQPDGVHLTVHGTKVRAKAELFEGLLTLESIGSGPVPLERIRCARRQAKETRRAPFRNLWRKISGHPNIYEGLWELLAQVYAAIEAKRQPPIGIDDVAAVSRLVADLTREECRL